MYTLAMEWIAIPPRGSRLSTPLNALHTVLVLLFVASMLAWILMAFFVHDFARLHSDEAHSFPVREHGGTFFVNHMLGSLYVNMPWIWLSTLGASVLITFFRGQMGKGVR